MAYPSSTYTSLLSWSERTDVAIACYLWCPHLISKQGLVILISGTFGLVCFFSFNYRNPGSDSWCPRLTTAVVSMLTFLPPMPSSWNAPSGSCQHGVSEARVKPGLVFTLTLARPSVYTHHAHSCLILSTAATMSPGIAPCGSFPWTVRLCPYSCT